MLLEYCWSTRHTSWKEPPNNNINKKKKKERKMLV